MNKTINLGFKKNDEITYFALLSDNEKKELFFQFLWDRLLPSTFYDGLDGVEKNITNLDHISFHRDGTIHLRYFVSSKRKGKILDKKLRNPIFSMPQSHYAPLLIFSFYDVETVRKHIGKSVPRIYDGFSNISYYWELEDANEFSLVLFLIGSEVNHILMLESHFKGIFNIKASPLLMNYFGDEDKVEMENGEVTKVNDFGLLIGYTQKTIPHPPTTTLAGPKKQDRFERIETAYGITLTPTDEMIMRRLG